MNFTHRICPYRTFVCFQRKYVQNSMKRRRNEYVLLVANDRNRRLFIIPGIRYSIILRRRAQTSRNQRTMYMAIDIKSEISEQADATFTQLQILVPLPTARPRHFTVETDTVTLVHVSKLTSTFEITREA